ncbi:MAG: tRNA pseudouridine(13) synthase TruD [Gammaproteobacteria bacterium]|nr:tRNA pseudouridine(13) synthase TruD [Gammaproteobacteria bacterium]
MDIATAPSAYTHLAYAYGPPPARGVFRSVPEDFYVEELLGFYPTGEGEHTWVFIEKRGANTRWVAGRLADAAGIKARDVGYAGLKDRHAVTRQWFSLYTPGRQSRGLDSLDPDEIRVLTLTRSAKKLRVGAHTGNRFRIRIRDLDGDRAALTSRLARIGDDGVPNYFGEQRFGRDGENLKDVECLFKAGKPGRGARRGIVLSAARAWIFNQVLHSRCIEQTWRTPQAGEWPHPDSVPTGPLWGRGRQRASGAAAAVELAVVNRYAHWARGLENAGMRLQRRRLVCMPQHFDYAFKDAQLRLSFDLHKGQYATAVLRELLLTSELLRVNCLGANNGHPAYYSCARA